MNAIPLIPLSKSGDHVIKTSTHLGNAGYQDFDGFMRCPCRHCALSRVIPKALQIWIGERSFDPVYSKHSFCDKKRHVEAITKAVLDLATA